MVLTVMNVFLNAIVFGFIISGFTNEIIKWGGWDGINSAHIGRVLVVYSAIVIVAIPFLMAVISLNFKSMAFVLLSLIPYLIFLPTLVGTFVMYSIARLADITWGNRISYTKSSFEGATKEEVEKLSSKLNIISGFVLLVVVMLNVGVATVLILFYSEPLVIGVIMVSIVGVFLVQCLFSIIYFFIKHIGCQTCKQRMK
jgi:hypothetical protein